MKRIWYNLNMYRVIGLGNPDEEYQDTAHNIGKQVLDIFLDKNKLTFFSHYNDRKRNADLFNGEVKFKEVELIFFNGFMNTSGDSFSGVFSKENDEEKENVIVIYDDINLPFGEIKISFDRGDGGHNGIKDIVKKLKTKKFIRVRIGVCPLDFFGNCRKPKSGPARNKYLTDKQLARKYTEKYSDYAEKFEKILDEIIKDGYSSAMNKFN